MVGFLLIPFPFVLLGFVLLMERVEQPLTGIAPEREMQKFLHDASPEQVGTYVRETTPAEPAPAPVKPRPRRLGRRRPPSP